jgi:hypothetical protein
MFVNKLYLLRICVIKRDVMRFFVESDQMRKVIQNLFRDVKAKFKKISIYGILNLDLDIDIASKLVQ